LFGISDFTTDPLKAAHVRVGYAGSGTGGSVVFTDDGGTARWLSGVPGTAQRDFRIYDNANAADRLTVSAATGIATFSSGLVVNTTAGHALTVNGVSNSYAALIQGNGAAGSNFGLAIQGGLNAFDTALVVTNASGSTAYFTVRGDGNAIFSTSVFAAQFFGTNYIALGSNTPATGVVRLQNNTAVTSRNGANTGDYIMLYLDGSNITQISSSGQLTNFSGHILGQGNITAVADIKAGGTLYAGAASSGHGGQVNLLDDTGASHWAVGIPHSAGGTSFFIYDIVRSTTVLSIDPTTGIVAGIFSGPLAGNVTGNVTGSSGSCTGNAASASSVAAGNISGTIGDSQIGSLTASKLTGALPAISGANLTSLTGANVTGTVGSASNAASLGGVAAASYALLSGATFTGDISVPHANRMSAGAFYVI
jgi:hypothetical protein